MTENFKWEIISRSLEPSELIVDETLFHTANGYLGVRGNFEEGYPSSYDTIRGSYINGVYDVSEVKHGEKLHGFIESKQKIVNITDVQGIQLFIEGNRFSLFEGQTLEYRRTLDMRAGVVKRHVVWKSPKGHIFEIDICRMASFVKPELFLIDYTVKSINYEGEVVLVSTQMGDVSNYFNPDDPRVSGELEKHLTVTEIRREDQIDFIYSKTKHSELRLASAVKHVMSTKCQVESTSDKRSLTSKIRFNIKRGNAERLIKYCIFTDSIRYSDCIQSASCGMYEVIRMPIQKLYALQEDYLNSFWKTADVAIEGDETLQQGIHFSIFQLLQSVGKDKYSNIAAKGLSGEGYEGHYFWDTEIYILPFFLLTNQKIAENLLSYRYEKLDAAKRNARIMGHQKGALYPWRTISGSECSAYFPSGSAQYHINADIAYMFVQHYLITKNVDFVINKSAEVLFETARLWMDAGHYTENSFRIDAVTGPDEYTCLVNNNYYTNVMAKHNLKWAVKFYKLIEKHADIALLSKKIGLKEKEIKEWEEACQKMYLPYDEKLDINPQDDTFFAKAIWDFNNTPKENYPLLLHYHPLCIYRYQVCKQADAVLAHFLLEDEQKLSTIQKSFDYYEKITTHDSSLSTCIFSIMGARLKNIHKAYDYFIQTTRLDLDNTHHNTKDGIHTANMGGTYMGMVYGFAGLRIKETGIYFNPIIPDQWGSYEFKICYQDRVIKVHINKEKCSFELLVGGALIINVLDNGYYLKGELVIDFKTKYKAVIFDLDGVLVDTAKYHFLAWGQIAKSLGVIFTEKDNEALKGVSRMASLDILLHIGGVNLTDEEKKQLANRKNKIYVEYILKLTGEDILPGALDLLEALKAKGIKTAIGSASKNTPLIMERLGIKKYFQAISDGNNTSKAKPDPEVFIKAAKMLGVVEEECIVFEDAKAGIEAAKKAGMYAVGVGKKEDLPGADRWIQSLCELEGESVF